MFEEGVGLVELVILGILVPVALLWYLYKNPEILSNEVKRFKTWWRNKKK